MPHRSTYAYLDKFFRPLLTLYRVRSGLTALTQQLFADTDTTARQRGWQVTATHRGFGRRYRDRRFDTLRSCAECSGRGFVSPGAPCPGCGGTGRLTVRPADEPPSSPRGLA